METVDVRIDANESSTKASEIKASAIDSFKKSILVDFEDETVANKLLEAFSACYDANVSYDKIYPNSFIMGLTEVYDTFLKFGIDKERFLFFLEDFKQSANFSVLNLGPRIFTSGDDANFKYHLLVISQNHFRRYIIRHVTQFQYEIKAWVSGEGRPKKEVIAINAVMCDKLRAVRVTSEYRTQMDEPVVVRLQCEDMFLDVQVPSLCSWIDLYDIPLNILRNVQVELISIPGAYTLEFLMELSTMHTQVESDREVLEILIKLRFLPVIYM